MREVKWSTAIPLVGGSAVGCYAATNTLPQYHLSYSVFDKNEQHLLDYWPEIPRINLDEVRDLPEGRIDFINSVCPCAGLSLLSTAKSREVRDKSNKWMFETADVVLGKIKPRVYFGENAPGLFTNMGSWVREALIEKAQKYGYSFSLYRTTTSLHGIPQNRLRTFYFFWDTDTPPILNYYLRPRKNLVEYLEEIPLDASSQDEFVRNKPLEESSLAYNFVMQKLGLTHTQFIEKYDRGSIHSFHTFITENNLLDECISWIGDQYGSSKELLRLKKIREKLAGGGRYMDGSPAYYYETCNALVGRNLTGITHPKHPRFLSVREVMHLMGLPHNFEFSLAAGASLNTLAQNVPACTSRDMTLEVLKFLRNELEYHNEPFVKQDNIKQRIVK